MKKVLSIVLSLLMMVSVVAAVPFSASATDEVAPISECTVSLSSTSLVYTGKAQQPNVIVKDATGADVPDDSYVVSDAQSIEVGQHSLTVTMQGEYTGSHTLTYKIVPKAPTKVKVANRHYNQTRITWSKVTNATGYAVYRSTNKKSWTRIATVKKGSTVSYNDTKRDAKTTYYYTIRTYQKADGVNYYSPLSEIPSVKSTFNTKASSAGATQIQVSWDKQSGVTGYVVYRSTDAKSWARIGVVKGASTKKYRDTKAVTGIKYYYTVRAYTTVDSKNVYGLCAGTSSAKAIPAKVTVKSVSARYGDVTIQWNKVAGASGYQIFRSKSADGGYEFVKALKSNHLSYVDSVERNQKYYYRVRAFTTVNGKHTYGTYSDVKSIRLRAPFEPSFSATMSKSSNAKATSVYVKIKNTGKATMQIHPESAMGDVYNEEVAYELKLVDYNYWKSTKKYKALKYVNIKPGETKTVLFQIVDGPVAYNTNRLLACQFMFDGEYYILAANAVMGTFYL